MKINEIERFFSELDKRIRFSLTVILTGGAAGIIYGAERATQDIDFEVQLKLPLQKRAEVWPEFQQALEDVQKMTGIIGQFSEDIDRWSSIAMPSKKSSLWKKIGKIEVRLLAPSMWAIGKLSRFLVTDEDDIVAAFKNHHQSPKSLAHLWGEALRISPASDAQLAFRRHVERFFQVHGKEIWGKQANVEAFIKAFLKTATTPVSPKAPYPKRSSSRVKK